MNIGICSAAVRRRLVAGLVGAAALAAPAIAGAAEVNATLDSLLSPTSPGLTLGDKRYTNFTFSSSGDAAIAPGAVDVVLSSDDNNRYNLRFTFSRTALAAPAGETTDVVVCYDVNVIGGLPLINGVGLEFDTTVGQGQTAGVAAASVTETVSTLDGSDVAPGGLVQDTEIISVFNDGAGGLGDNDSALLTVNPTSGLRFCKDIIVSSRPEGGRVVISTVDNFVNQIPEPGSVALLGIAAAGLLVRRRKA